MYGTQLEGPLRNLWFPTPDRATAYETSFIVVGPIPNDNPGHLTTGVASNSGVAGACIQLEIVVCVCTIEPVLKSKF
jgi:hypothetical protein